MKDTLPFAPVALRELAAIWQRQLAELDPASDAGDLRSQLAQVCLQIFNTDPDETVQRDAVERILALHDARPNASSRCTTHDRSTRPSSRGSPRSRRSRMTSPFSAERSSA